MKLRSVNQTVKMPDQPRDSGIARQSCCEQLIPAAIFGYEAHDEKALLLQIAGGDVTAFRKLYERHRRKVYFIAWKLLETKSESEDVVQEIFANVWVNREKLEGIEYFNSWLNTLIRNHLFNRLRKKANEEIFIHELSRGYCDKTGQERDEVEIRELQVLLNQAVNKLTTQQKKVFQLSRMEGFKHSEIADTLGISIETVKKHIMQAVSRLRDLLKEKTE